MLTPHKYYLFLKPRQNYLLEIWFALKKIQVYNLKMGRNVQGRFTQNCPKNDFLLISEISRCLHISKCRQVKLAYHPKTKNGLSSLNFSAKK